jgi:hypothetical protein
VPEETHRREQFSLQISYREDYSEEEQPIIGLAYPTQSPESFIKTSISTNNKVLGFLAVISTTCLGALVLAPVPIVQVAAVTIWLGSLKFAHRALTSPAKLKHKK